MITKVGFKADLSRHHLAMNVYLHVIIEYPSLKVASTIFGLLLVLEPACFLGVGNY
jgi:hypothetical protein